MRTNYRPVQTPGRRAHSSNPKPCVHLSKPKASVTQHTQGTPPIVCAYIKTTTVHDFRKTYAGCNASLRQAAHLTGAAAITNTAETLPTTMLPLPLPQEQPLPLLPHSSRHHYCHIDRHRYKYHNNFAAYATSTTTVAAFTALLPYYCCCRRERRRCATGN